MISRTKIKSRVPRKTNSELAETILTASKHDAWRKLAQRLSNSTKHYSSVNLDKIDSETTAGDTVVIPGKVLSLGNLAKKVRICSLAISASAKEKLKATKSEYVSILDEIKKNPKAQGVKIIQ